MLIDTRSLDDGTAIEADICIVGSGAAGLTLAHALLGSRNKVVVLEAGGRDYDAADQDVYSGDLVGLPYFLLDVARLRQYGGTTNHWAGHCRGYLDHALEHRPWVPHSGWPITRDEVEPYEVAAARLLGLPEAGSNAAYWAERLGLRELPLRPGVFGHFTVLIRPVRFAQAFGSRVEADPDAVIYLHANLVDIATDASASTVTGMTARTRDGERTLHVRARRYVLATGGIENARLLLLADQVAAGGIGNRHDLVGRYFTDHVTFLAGMLRPADPGIDFAFYERHWLDDLAVYSRLDLPFEVVARERLLPASLALLPRYDPAWTSRGVHSAKSIVRAVRGFDLPSDLGRHIGNIAGELTGMMGLGWRSMRTGGVPIEEVELRSSLAPAPNPESRVLLGDQVDAFGQRRVKLDWRLSPIDKQSVRLTIETFAAEVGAAGIGRVQVLIDESDDLDGLYIEPANHHLCTTRMADDPRQGVVDRNCRVHGVDNLYCAGSSVFSTAGDGTPTMMIVALALRLADHLDELGR